MHDLCSVANRRIRLNRITKPADPLELWGGIECTVNRVGDRFYNQLHRNGHLYRVEDIDLLAELDVKKIRYPILWELHSTNPVDWTWAAERLERIKAHRMAPIVGFVHHGSGPEFTNLL